MLFVPVGLCVDFFQLQIHDLLCKDEFGKGLCAALQADVKCGIWGVWGSQTSPNNPVGAQSFRCSQEPWLLLDQKISVPGYCQATSYRRIVREECTFGINFLFSGVPPNSMYHATYLSALAG